MNSWSKRTTIFPSKVFQHRFRGLILSMLLLFTCWGATACHAALYYRRDGLNVAINIRNLFDNDYVISTFGASSAQRDAPFTITGSISWKF